MEPYFLNSDLAVLMQYLPLGGGAHSGSPGGRPGHAGCCHLLCLPHLPGQGGGAGGGLGPTTRFGPILT